MEYDVYHDESKEAGYWHGMLFVPRPSRAKLLEHIKTIRREANYEFPLSLKGLRSHRDCFQCSRAAVQLVVAAMMQEPKGSVQKVYVGKRMYDTYSRYLATDYREIVQITEPLKLRFVVFRERDCLKFLDPEGHFLDYGAKVETTFRMGFKGGLHLLFDENDSATITSIHFDGYEHYRRHVDTDRIIGRLEGGLRSYCQIAENIDVDDRTSDHRKDSAQDYDDCQFLQLADLLVGSFRTVLADSKNEVQAEVAHPVSKLVEKWRAGPARMANSRWNGGFCVSQCYLEDGKWKFSALRPRVQENQLGLGL